MRRAQGAAGAIGELARATEREQVREAAAAAPGQVRSQSGAPSNRERRRRPVRSSCARTCICRPRTGWPRSCASSARAIVSRRSRICACSGACIRTGSFPTSCCRLAAVSELHTLTRAGQPAAGNPQEPFHRAGRAGRRPGAGARLYCEIGDPQATHNCWAYRIGQQYRFSDDGEPGGTAGRPILQAIEGQGFDQVVVVVTRWYGGIKLGAGGLARAYGGCAAECLRLADRVPIVESRRPCMSSANSPGCRSCRRAWTNIRPRRSVRHFDATGADLHLRLPRDQLDGARRSGSRPEPGRASCVSIECTLDARGSDLHAMDAAGWQVRRHDVGPSLEMQRGAVPIRWTDPRRILTPWPNPTQPRPRKLGAYRRLIPYLREQRAADLPAGWFFWRFPRRPRWPCRQRRAS